MRFDFEANRRTQLHEGRKNPIQTFDLEGILNAAEAAQGRQQQAASTASRNEAAFQGSGEAGWMNRARIERQGGEQSSAQVAAAADEENDSIWGRLFEEAKGVYSGDSTLGKLIAPVNPVAMTNQAAKHLPGRDKAATLALDSIDRPRRATMVGISSIAPKLPEWHPYRQFIDYESLESDERSNREKFNDPSFGFGDIAKDTGNKWADRGIGLAGDVALDPVAYLTFGSTAFAGQAGRASAVGILNAANLRATAAGGAKLFSDDAIRKVGTHGLATADDAMRKALGQQAAGVQAAGLRIPGTGKLAKGVGEALGSVRYDLGKTPLGRVGSAIRSPASVKESIDIVAGRGPAHTKNARAVDEALAVLGTGEPTRRSVAGMVKAKFREPELAKGLRKEKAPGRRILTAELEDVGNRASTNPLIIGARRILDEIYEMSKAAGMSGLARIDNYVPHYVTKQGREALANISQWSTRKSSKRTINMAQSKGSAFSREFKPNSTYFVVGPDGVQHTVRLEQASITEINEKIGQRIFGHDIMEADLAPILERAIQDAADDISVAAMIKKLETTNPEMVASYKSLMADESFGGDTVRQLKLGSAKTPGVADPVTMGPDGVKWNVPKAQRRNAAKRAQRALIAVDEGWSNDTTSAFVKAGKQGKLGDRIGMMIDEGFEMITAQSRGAGDEIIATPQIKRAFEQVKEATRDKRFVDALAGYLDFTRLFKSYATMTPGFHLRNGMSGMFMNFSDGVTVQDHLQAVALMRKLANDGPEKFFNELTPIERVAFEGAVGSGMAGSVSASETRLAQQGRGGVDLLAEKGGAGGRAAAKVLRKADTNSLQRIHMAVGQMGVEGPLRLAAALSTAKAGHAAGRHADDVMSEAITRVTRLHFDYGQVSQVDGVAKGIIPFWTFVSRNIPLQLQQQFQKPRAYQRYAAVQRQFQDGENDPMPEWMTDQGFGKFIGDDNNTGFAMSLTPDMPFTDMPGDAKSLSTVRGLASMTNPLVKLPAELGLNQKMFNGSEFYEDENKWLYALKALLPPLGRAEGLSGGWLERFVRDAEMPDDPTEGQLARQARADEYSDSGKLNKALKLLGAPVTVHDDRLRESGGRVGKAEMDQAIKDLLAGMP